MLQDDFKALLWSYGGNLGSGSGRIDPEMTRQPELFLLAASDFISNDARLATCVFNLVIEMAPKLSPQILEKGMLAASYDARRLGVLVSIVREEQNRRGELASGKRWEPIEEKLHRAVPPMREPEPLISHLPRLPCRRDPLFLAWGFEYPGIVREPGKYLRKAI